MSNQVPAAGSGQPTPLETIQFSTASGEPVTIPNLFRGMLVVGAADSGKSKYVVMPLIEELARKNFAGLIYDTKAPQLESAAYLGSPLRGASEVQLPGPLPITPPEGEQTVVVHFLNFQELYQSEKVNPWRPQDLLTVSQAVESAGTLLDSQRWGRSRQDDFFARTVRAYLGGILWYYRNHYPALCTVPHVAATAQHDDFKLVLRMLAKDPDCRNLVQSLIMAVEQGAEKQIAGVISLLKVELADLVTAEACWVLTPDEAAGEGFSLDLNNPQAPKLLYIGSGPRVPGALRTVTACLIATAIRRMNQPQQHRSFVLLDGGETIHVPGLEVLPATGRANKVALVYVTQDVNLLTETYGKERAQVLLSCLSNQVFGRAASLESAQLIANLVDKHPAAGLPTDQVDARRTAYTLGRGEFIVRAAGAESPVFQAAFAQSALKARLRPFQLAEDEFKKAVGEKVQQVSRQVHEALATVGGR